MAEQNHMQVIFDAKSVNESLARMVVTAFMTDMNPTLEQVSDVKTAVSEAVTNAIIHGYENKEDSVELCCDRDGQQLIVTVEDHGVGIADVERARNPFYTTKPELERSGMGFTFMEAFMDKVEVCSQLGVVAMESSVGVESISKPVAGEDSAGALTIADQLEDKKPFEGPILNRIALQQVMDELDEGEVRLISLRYMQNHTQAEVAQILGTNQVAVSRQERHILGKLRKKLA